MDQNAWIMLFVGIAISCGLFALGIVLYPKLKTEKQGYPFEAEIEAALLVHRVPFHVLCFTAIWFRSNCYWSYSDNLRRD